MPSETEASLTLSDIDTDFGHAGISLPRRDRTERRPANHRFSFARHQTRERRMGRVPDLPRRSLRFERRLSGGDAFQVNLAHRRPINRLHWIDSQSHEFTLLLDR